MKGMMSYDDEMLGILAAHGVVLGADGRFARSPEYAGPDPVTDEQIRYLNESAGQSNTNARLKGQWVDNLWEVVQTLDRDGEAAPWPFMAIFWIRLHGVLVDLRSEFVDFFRMVGIDPATYRPSGGSDLHVALTTFGHIEVVRQRLTDDELIYADYRRHTEGHPTQRSYDVHWSRGNGGQVVDRRRVPAVGREFTVGELDAAIRRVLLAHPNEGEIAVSFAKRIRLAAAALVDVMRIYSSR